MLIIVNIFSCSSLYSQTKCSFDDNLANFCCNIGILIDSLSGESCNMREQVSSFIWYVSWKCCIFHDLHKSQKYYFTWKKRTIIALWSSGVKQKQIAEVVGLLPQTVSNTENKWTKQLACAGCNFLCSNCRSI